MRASAGITRHATSPTAAFHVRPPRKTTFLAGKLAYGDGLVVPDGAFTLDCAIRDISEGGAKISLLRQQSLPRELYLIVIKYGIAYRAQIAWQSYPTRGLKFLTPYCLSGALPAGVGFLRHLWIELTARDGVDAVENGRLRRLAAQQ